ncbi:hypothetical protein K3M35_05205 [Rhodococcus sp. DMU2021]|uniref:hypothetical protein n=1 Tax=Rhodococcus sp. DMU2021 TaxID=2866997 RepID=UPI001C7C9ED7|nr:hypothetical protein [Rhodococcus sp. DMU2021]MBX4168064.1 hypothetical protein [Rhodococcus sp. DMU2021]
MTARKWGKAGERLDPVERQKRLRELAIKRNQDEARQKRDLEEGLRLWRAGKLIPWRITLALNAIEADGPEVDIACGAREPDVDHWELGIKYPTWEQTEALSRYTGFTVPWFCIDERPPSVHDTTLRFHLPKAHVQELERAEKERVCRFLPDAIAATLDGREYVHEPTQEALW